MSSNLPLNADTDFDTGVCGPRRNSDGNIIEINNTTAGKGRTIPTPQGIHQEDVDSSEDFKEDQRFEMLMDQAKAELNGNSIRKRQQSWSLSSNSLNNMQFLDSYHGYPSRTSRTASVTSSTLSTQRKFSIDRHTDDLHRQSGTTI